MATASGSSFELPTLDTVSLERDGHVLLIGLNRPHKRNSFDRAMLADLARAYAVLESDTTVWAGVLFAHGDHFTAGLDLVDVGPGIATGQSPLPDDGRDPWRLDGAWTTPLVAVAQGWCMTLGIELLLAADIRIAAAGTRFTQLEGQRGIYPFGGATIRLPRDAGWGNATLASAHLARKEGEVAAIEQLRPAVVELFASEDAAEGVQSFIERRQARFH